MKKLRHISMNTKFKHDGTIYTRVWADRGKDEDGNEVQINKNTYVEELDEILEETNKFEERDEDALPDCLEDLEEDKTSK